MARGGRRTGAPQSAYQNRTDLQQPIQVVAGQPYGERKRLEQAQQVIPLPNAGGGPAAPPAQPAPPAGPPSPQAAPAPQLDFARPTERPNEPVTTPPPMMPSAGDIVGAQLRALYATTPNNDLLRLIALHDQQKA